MGASDVVMTAGTNLANLIPELWSSNFYPALKAGLPWIGSVDMSYQGEIQQLGDTVNVSQFPEFGAAVDLAEDQANDAAGITVSNIQLVINKQIVQDFIVTRKALLQSLDALNELNDLAMFSVMKKIQDLIITATVPSASAPDHQIGYTSGTTLALADILAAKELLDTANVDGANRISILGAAQKNDLFNITGFTSRDYVPAGSPLSSGDINVPVCGFEIKETTVVSNTARFFHPSYLTMAVQESPAVEVFNMGNEGKRATRVNLTSLLGIKQMDSVRVVSIS
jgi:hypothetical protein